MFRLDDDFPIFALLMRKLLAIICLSIFSFQIIPVKAIGKMLWNNQMTEEVHENGPCCKKMPGDTHDRFWYLHFITPATEERQPEVCYKHALRDEALIKCHHLEVPVQPPNVG